MVRPVLIHPVPIKYKVLDKANTNYDDDAREPIRVAKKKAEVTLNAQVKWTTDGEVVITPGGATVEITGYVLFETQELENKSIDPKFGDQITEISGKTYDDLFVVRTKPMGHYPDIGGPGLLRTDFNRREKAA
jgi:hypothetical protein